MTEPVSALSSRPPLPFVERLVMFLSRGLERVLWSAHLGLLTARRASALAERGDTDLALRLLHALRNDASCSARVHALAAVLEASVLLRTHDLVAMRAALTNLDIDTLTGDHAVAAAQLAAYEARSRRDFGRMLAAAEAGLRKKDAPGLVVSRAIALKNLGRIEEALEGATRYQSMTRGSTGDADLIAAGYSFLAGRPGAREAAQSMLRSANGGAGTGRLNIAWLAAVLGEDERALDELGHTIDGTGSHLDRIAVASFLDVEADFDRLRNHPRFLELRARLDHPEGR